MTLLHDRCAAVLRAPAHTPPRLFLRRAVASVDHSVHGKHIPFHRDHALATVNVALNELDTFRGGRLLVVTAGEVRCFDERRGGHAVVMNGGHVHAVSSLTSGGRYSLFVVQPSAENGSDVLFPSVLAESQVQ